MKFRYYLRGAGVGIIVATIILAIVFKNYKPTMSAEEIIKEAEKLGMIMPEDSADNKGPENPGNENPEGGNDEGNDAGTDTENGQTNDETQDLTGTGENKEETVTSVMLTIERGDTSEIVSEKLLALGLITDAADFNEWLCEKKKLASNIMIGTHEIPMGATYEEIGEIITH